MTRFDRNPANDGIHDIIHFNEIAPKHGWLEHYRHKDDKDVLLAALLVLAYLVACTLVYYWG